MINNFLVELLEKLDNRYDEIVYDECINILKVRVDKTNTFKDLSGLVEELSKEIMYPLQSFHSNPNSYTFTYRLRDKE